MGSMSCVVKKSGATDRNLASNVTVSLPYPTALQGRGNRRNPHPLLENE
jgi:hypothetical protein